MISNGGNFQIAARLAYITGNETYGAWATMVWDWMADSLMFERSDGILYIWDNVDADQDCTGEAAVQRLVWSYNYGVLLGGAAYMYNFTDGDPEWLNRVEELLESAFQLYFPPEYGGNIMVEFHCEEDGICNQDQKSFKAYLSRWLAATAMLVPGTYDRIMPKLRESAIGAARQCKGGASGNMCSAQWWTDVPTGRTGVGEQVSWTSVSGV
jgi:mannan endo-1,6-alpha-mannosidase